MCPRAELQAVELVVQSIPLTNTLLSLSKKKVNYDVTLRDQKINCNNPGIRTALYSCIQSIIDIYLLIDSTVRVYQNLSTIFHIPSLCDSSLFPFISAKLSVTFPLVQNKSQLETQTILYILQVMGGSPGDVSEEPVTQKKQKKGWRMNCDLGEATEGKQRSFYNLSVTSPTSQLILQPFRRFTYVTAHSPTFPFLHQRHSSFSNPSFASPTSQALHLCHLASRP